MTLRFDGKVALITGGGRGIGRAHAQLLAARGCRVVVADAGFAMTGAPGTDDPASVVVAEIKTTDGVAVAYRGDVRTDAARMVACALDTFGRLDILINNAGPVGSFKLFAETPADDWQMVSDMHYRGTVEMCRAAWPALVAAGSARIINTASSAMLGSEMQTDYGSAKAAIFGFTRLLALEGRTSGITVNCILPSSYSRMMETIKDRTVRAASEKLMGPEHIAALVAWLAHHETTVTGETFNVSGGRAARVVIAAAPAVKVAASTPEMWRDAAGRLLSEGPFTRLTTMGECFAAELLDLDPTLEPHISNYLNTGIELPIHEQS